MTDQEIRVYERNCNDCKHSSAAGWSVVCNNSKRPKVACIGRLANSRGFDNYQIAFLRHRKSQSMARTLSEFEEQDMKDLKALVDDERFQLPFGPSALQRKLFIGYNRAARLIQSGVEAGVLYTPENKPYLAAFHR